MPWTQDDIDKLKAAIAAGGVVKSITFSDQTYEFRDLDEMLKLLSIMSAEVATASGAPKGYRLASTSKGV